MYAMVVLSWNVIWVMSMHSSAWYHYALLGFVIAVLLASVEMNIALVIWYMVAAHRAHREFLQRASEKTELELLRSLARVLALGARQLNPDADVIQAGPIRLKLEADGSVTVLPPETFH